MYTTIKSYIVAFVALVIVALYGRNSYNKRRADRKAKEVEDLETEIQANDINHEVKNFEAVNIERKENTDEKIHTKPISGSLDPHTTYSL